MTRQSLKNATILGVLMFLNYCGNSISFRMVGHGSYTGVAITDALIAWYGFTMTKHIVAAETVTEKIGYTAGAVIGSLSGLWLSMVLGK
jgi:hypothetical protein